MTTFTVWKFDSPEGADSAVRALTMAEADGLVHVVDRAVVSWPADAAKPNVDHAHLEQWRGSGWGALWGLLLGALFFVPVLGAAAGAMTGAVAKAAQGVGINKEQFERLQREVVPGTSALFAVTERADVDRLAERFPKLHSTLIATNLTDAERQELLDAFG